MKVPEVSVVMSVFNGAAALPATLESILRQKDCAFEFIVVNDGSTDDSGIVLDQWAQRDGRFRVIHQANAGLTRALIRGCSDARGAFIARQDCGDVSHPDRLRKQLERLRADLTVVAASCHTQFVGPKDEPLYVSEISEAQLNTTLARGINGTYLGPSHHGSVMMRRATYFAVGGYRAAFYFAQDLDLWTRVAEAGQFAVVSEVLYEASLDPGSISGTQIAEQRALANLISLATQARRSGKTENGFLMEAALIRSVRNAERSKRIAMGNYFIGSCLRQSNPRGAAAYFRQALRDNPWLWRARLRWLQAALTTCQ